MWKKLIHKTNSWFLYEKLIAFLSIFALRLKKERMVLVFFSRKLSIAAVLDEFTSKFPFKKERLIRENDLRLACLERCSLPCVLQPNQFKLFLRDHSIKLLKIVANSLFLWAASPLCNVVIAFFDGSTLFTSLFQNYFTSNKTLYSKYEHLVVLWSCF